MVQHGRTLQQALATIGASAKLMGLADRDRLSAGLRADLVILGGDPLADIAHCRQVEMVFLAGERIR